MNGYSNIVNKDSFSIEIITCDQAWHEEPNYCAPDDEIAELVSNLVMTQYML